MNLLLHHSTIWISYNFLTFSNQKSMKLRPHFTRVLVIYTDVEIRKIVHKKKNCLSTYLGNGHDNSTTYSRSVFKSWPWDGWGGIPWPVELQKGLQHFLKLLASSCLLQSIPCDRSLEKDVTDAIEVLMKSVEKQKIYSHQTNFKINTKATYEKLQNHCFH